MKKTLIAIVAVMLLASSSFAGVSYLVAPGVGEGKWAVLGMYATNHQGGIANAGEPQWFDATSLGVRGSYGLMDGLDLLAAYSMDTLVNFKDFANPAEIDAKQESGSTIGLGVKYTVTKYLDMLPVDSAVAVGYEQSSAGVKSDLAKATMTTTSYNIAAIFSKKIDMFVPYGAIALKSLSRDVGKVNGARSDAAGGTSLGFNLGCMIGIAADQAVAIEYNTENQAYTDYKVGGVKMGESAVNVSGISLGYIYMF